MLRGSGVYGVLLCFAFVGMFFFFRHLGDDGNELLLSFFLVVFKLNILINTEMGNFEKDIKVH